MNKTGFGQIPQEKIRNIAIIAHVDHGKTTLVDAFLKQSNLFRQNQDEMKAELILDYGELEREKGITITAKNVSIKYKDYKINIIDTPGHADFGGEVERTLNMADGCLLLVDAQEGPRPQTKFVLKKAFELNLTPLVVINKIDKKFAHPQKTLDQIHDLFLELATKPEQLEFPVYYAIGREGKAFKNLPEGDLTIPNSIKGNILPLLDAIIETIPAPTGDPNEPLQMQISSLSFDPNQGRFLLGKIKRGSVKTDDTVVICSDKKEVLTRGKIKNVLVREGLEFRQVKEARAGEIAAVVGIDSTNIGSTICSQDTIEPLSPITITPPAVKIKFEASTSPFVGRDGKFVTQKQIEQRLDREKETNIGLHITKSDAGSYYVAGRGELQLSILIETLRREGYEFQIRKPEVIFKYENGEKKEPLEELFIETKEEYIGTITAALSARNAEMKNLETENAQAQFVYTILTRNLLGLRSELLTATKGNIVMNNFLIDYVSYTQQAEPFRRGVLAASDPGTSKGYALNTIQERGDLFIGPGVDVYEGMIVGMNKYENDLDVNVAKERHKSAHRIKHDEITQTKLKAIFPLTLEFALSFLGKDEVLEVTPHHLRLRKLFLTKNERIWSKRKNLSEFAKEQMGEKK
jgi:GTP-binding protein